METFLLILIFIVVLILLYKYNITLKKQKRIIKFIGLENELLFGDYNEDKSMIEKLSTLFSKASWLERRQILTDEKFDKMIIELKNEVNDEKNKIISIKKFLDIKTERTNNKATKVIKLYPQKAFFLRLYDAEGYFWDEFKSAKRDKLFSVYKMTTLKTDPYKAEFSPIEDKIIMDIALSNPKEYLIKACDFEKNKKRGYKYKLIKSGMLERNMDKWIITRKCKIEVVGKNSMKNENIKDETILGQK